MPPQASILHVDMDSFYASVEVLEDPALRGRPVIVGGSGERGVVASCNYEARAFGVHSAMPSVRARRLCPDAVFVHGRHELYAAYSRRIHEVFLSYTPLVEGISLDEAFLDVAGARRLFGSGDEIARSVRRRIAEEVGLGCAVGVATSKLIAKLASKAAKPRPSRLGSVAPRDGGPAARPGASLAPDPGPGIVSVAPGEELAFLHPLPVGALWGVGPATHRRLERFGVVTVGDLAAIPVDTLVKALGPSLGRHLHDLAWALDARPVAPGGGTKSIGHEETYARDLHDRDGMHREVVRMADAVAGRLRAAGLAARTVTVKVRFHDFATIARSHTSAVGIDTGPAVARVATMLVDRVDPASGVRLLGVSVTRLVPRSGPQLTFEGDGPPGATTAAEERAARAVDQIRRRFGDAAVGPATLAGDGRLRVKRQGEDQWGPRGKGDR